MSLGHSLCPSCQNDPAIQLHPCGHKICYQHYLQAEGDCTTCGICGQGVFNTSELRSRTPVVGPIHPRDTTWSHNSSTASGVMQRSRGGSRNGRSSTSESIKDGSNNGHPTRTHDGSSHGGSNNGGMANGNIANNGNSFVNFSYRNPVPATPTPAPRVNNNGAMAPRYVPPAMRNQAQSETHQPSASSMGFASQPQTPSSNTRYGNGGNHQQSTGGSTQSNGQYSYGPSQLAQQFAQLDVFGGAPPRMQPYTNGNHANTTYTNGTYANGTYANGNGARRPTPGTTHSTPSSTNRLGNGNIVTLADPTSNASAANNSAVPQSRAEYLAALIKSGATDDPYDIDYGNPGPSRRAPPPPQLAPTTPLQRGDIARGAGQNNSTIAMPGHGPNIDGNAILFVNVTDTSLPSWFVEIPMGFKPAVEQMLAVLPIVEACRSPKPSTAGVIRINNIPYSTSRSEILAFLGRNAQIIPQPPGSPYHAVHIMMDRQSGKTLDAFVEVENTKEAMYIVNQMRRRVQNGRHAKIGDRSVEVKLSSQQELMSEMFPRAKNTTWHGSMPIIDPRITYYYKDKPSSGFIGFLQDEEVVHMAKHAETPQRSPFAQRCLIRTYECLISTLHKYPWYDVEHVLYNERHNLYETVKICVVALINFLIKEDVGHMHRDHTQPSEETLKELIVAALTCPGFSESQKALIVNLLKQGGFKHLAVSKGMNLRFGGVDAFSDAWPFSALVKHPAAPMELVQYLCGLFRDATGKSDFSVADFNAMPITNARPGQFASIYAEYGAKTTLADIGRAELRGVEAMLRTVLPSIGSNKGSRAGSSHS